MRRDCPWDREQNAKSIVTHTVEEAYELADAARGGESTRMVDELGDVLFQVIFLSLLLEESGDGSLQEVADHCTEKLIRRHPHVFGGDEVESAAEVLEKWDRNKMAEKEGRGIFEDVPELLPALLYARKFQRRAATSGFDWDDIEGPLAKVDEELAELKEVLPSEAPTTASLEKTTHGSDRLYHELGDLLFATVNLARKLRVDPELALRESSNRFKARVERAEALATAGGKLWTELDLVAKEQYYNEAKRAEE